MNESAVEGTFTIICLAPRSEGCNVPLLNVRMPVSVLYYEFETLIEENEPRPDEPPKLEPIDVTPLISSCISERHESAQKLFPID